MTCLATYTGHYADPTKSDTDREADLDALDHYCDLAAALDCDLIRHNPSDLPEHRAENADYERAATWLRRAADRAAGDNVRLAVELHSVTVVESVSVAVDLFERIDRENVCAIHDAGNMYIFDVGYGADSVATPMSPPSPRPGRV